MAVAVAIACGFGAVRAQDDPDGWREWIAPTRLIGPIHYVGTRGLAAYLIETPQGHIVIDGAVPAAAPHISRAIETAGFKLRDVKILLNTQAHFDHVGTLADLKAKTGARVLVMQGDEGILASGGKTDYLFGSDPGFHFPAVKVDEVIRDGHTVTLGDITLRALHTPGHTPGSTTWTTTVVDGGKRYDVVFSASTYVNPGTRLVKQPSYPTIEADYRRSFARLESLEPEVFFAAHGIGFDFEAKRARAVREGVSVWVDPEGFRRGLAGSKQRFESLVAQER